MKRVGRFEPRAALGSHPMRFSMLYRAWDPLRACDVALKVLRDDIGRDSSIRGRFLAGQRAMAEAGRQAGAPGLVAIYESGEAEDTVFSSQALLSGGTLRDASLPPQPAGRVTAILVALGEAVGRLHAAGAVHGNIHPGNVAVHPPRSQGGDGRPAELLDPGVSALVRGSRYAPTGVFCGCVEYAAPDEPPTPASDVYALGVLAFHLLTGTPPFTGAWWEVGRAHAEQPVPPLWQLCPAAPPRLIAAVLESLAKDPHRRPPDGAALARLLL